MALSPSLWEAATHTELIIWRGESKQDSTSDSTSAVVWEKEALGGLRSETNTSLRKSSIWLHMHAPTNDGQANTINTILVISCFCIQVVFV